MLLKRIVSPQDVPVLTIVYSEMDTVNTQVAEQQNSVLQRIKNALSYMNQENFMRHCFFLWYRNKKIIEGLLQ